MNDVPLEGEILTNDSGKEGEEQEFNTLDEPVRETIVSVGISTNVCQHK
jgi:hypothetical protein